MNLDLNSKQNIYFVKRIKENEIILLEIPKTFIRFYKSNNFDLDWLKLKSSVISIKIKN